MNSVITVSGTAILCLLLAGYLGQRLLPPPKPRIVGIDLGTTFSCIGVYQAVSGRVDILEDESGHKCIPSVVSFLNEGILTGYHAVRKSEHNPKNTVYDAKRFIGKSFRHYEYKREFRRYPFEVVLDEDSMVHFVIGPSHNQTNISPEYVSSRIISTLRSTAEKMLGVPVTKAVMSVPAEFTEAQRNYTKKAASLAGIEVYRIINEPTAAAMAYGLHKKEGINNVMVIDLGGGTLDVSLLNIQGGMFLTQGMAGNNHLGGQDFNLRLLKYLLNKIHEQFATTLSDPEDMQALRQEVEQVKIELTSNETASIKLKLHSLIHPKNTVPYFTCNITRREFEDLNQDLFNNVLEPIDRILEETELTAGDVDEVVLVGGSTRIPKVRELVENYFKMKPNTAIDPELAVATGVSMQAGIIGGMWPLTVSAIELPTRVKKIQL